MNIRTVAKAAIGRIPRSVLYEVFYQSARTLGIQSYEAHGDEGSFFGPIYDQSVIKSYLANGSWSKNILSMFREYFGDEPGTMYDIGGNIGLIAIPIAKNPRIRTVSFEPEPRNCSLLRANVALAGVTVEVINAAVADRKGTMHFTCSDYNSGDHRLSSDGTIAVETIRLDDFPPAPGRFAVKIDTQGAEPAIFAGGANTLSQAGLIVSEFWPWGMRRMGLEPSPVLKFIEEHSAKGCVLKHDQVAGEFQSVGSTIDTLREVISRGGEYDQVDVVLAA
ncbi:MAG TPA: FkbM family methyltransferase [Aliidongia sp.]|uniref:FkbM family methyltransferase n=1 Tax=Aliidongia sp. TaxID=1914230 RepID=UPI002DDD2ABB|nr:FkbM family methyltransferase [Aliidongia sp.]HEV2677311.1 FkbM family methyltransferase [Aliidongia sp.]